MLMSLLKRNWSGWTPRSTEYRSVATLVLCHSHWKPEKICRKKMTQTPTTNEPLTERETVKIPCRVCSISVGFQRLKAMLSILRLHVFCKNSKLSNRRTHVGTNPIGSATKKSIPARASSDLRFPVHPQLFRPKRDSSPTKRSPKNGQLSESRQRNLGGVGKHSHWQPRGWDDLKRSCPHIQQPRHPTQGIQGDHAFPVAEKSTRQDF